MGRHLASALIARGDEVLGLGLGDGERPAGVREERVDILDLPALSAAIERMEPDCVIHLAGLSHVGKSWREMPAYFAVNVLGAENVTVAAGDRMMILASSSEVYGTVAEAEQPIVEDCPVAPRNPYGLTKAAAERLVLGRGGLVARMFNLIGPGQSPEFALPSFAAQLAAQRALGAATLKVGNLEARRDFVHVADAADAFVTLVSAGEPGQVYNLATGEALSIGRVLGELIEIAGLEVELQVDPARLRPVDVPVVRGSAAKLEDLGWRPKRGRRRALAQLWRAALEEADAVPSGSA